MIKHLAIGLTIGTVLLTGAAVTASSSASAVQTPTLTDTSRQVHIACSTFGKVNTPGRVVCENLTKTGHIWQPVLKEGSSYHGCYLLYGNINSILACADASWLMTNDQHPVIS